MTNKNCEQVKQELVNSAPTSEVFSNSEQNFLAIRLPPLYPLLGWKLGSVNEVNAQQTYLTNTNERVG